MQPSIRYNFEYPRKIRACHIGAGGHSFRNVLPAYQYAPIDLLAVCDLDAERARAYARQFGAQGSYTDYRAMLERERPDAVFVVASYEPDGRVQATAIAADALAAGAHVWMEKPTASSLGELRRLQTESARTHRFVMTGLKKTFTPAFDKLAAITRAEQFGAPTSLYLRYPQSLPPFAERRDGRRMIGFIDHIFHPGSVLFELMGNLHSLSYQWEPRTGSSVTALRFSSGAIGTLHLAAGASGSSPLERIEVVGEGASVVVDNGVRVTYYRPAERPAYGRSGSFLVDDAETPLVWEPEFSLGQLYNKNLFYLGYVPEILHFCEAVLAGQPPTKGTLELSAQILKLAEVYRRVPEGVWTEFGEPAGGETPA